MVGSLLRECAFGDTLFHSVTGSESWYPVKQRVDALDRLANRITIDPNPVIDLV
ncbi:Uncharacterised protein [Burkholderia pseudomallei]|nr:Uncharacterised protein [Burkholderia pseudomallei]CAJ2923238.1 Uncharacterised protein [Burkholderia pseudomallei]VBC67433.1 Uncharacterised protein [Burkholderia pseudomallei]VBE52641.1 Uncharacterised protein [Burkholderia pseudomallei]VBL88298.1 Uncharacterised protein [Burkholderia pseudomallei]